MKRIDNPIQQSIIAQAEKHLHTSIYTLLEETRTKVITVGQDLIDEKINEIKTKLGYLSEAEKYVHEYLRDPKDFEKSFDNIKHILSNQVIKYLQNYRNLLNCYSFKEAHAKLWHFETINHLIGGYFTE